jgi:hypothetical protein
VAIDASNVLSKSRVSMSILRIASSSVVMASARRLRIEKLLAFPGNAQPVERGQVHRAQRVNVALNAVISPAAR